MLQNSCIIWPIYGLAPMVLNSLSATNLATFIMRSRLLESKAWNSLDCAMYFHCWP